jgi:UDP-N-acetylmuramoylalanine--D-glutamate ligase
MDAYFSDKANIFRYQEERDTLILTPEVFEYAKKLNLTLGQEVVLVDDSLIPSDSVLTMPGAHNRLNYALALAALRATSLTDEEIFHGFATFPGVPGRLEYLGERNDLKVYNDNNATTPQATMMGLSAVGNSADKNVILIAGGADKGLAIDGLIEQIATYCKAVFLLPGTGTDVLAPQLGVLSETVHIEQVASLYAAVSSAFAHGVPGDTILFSPGYASFGMFQNEYDRNDQFVAAVNKLYAE